MAFLSPRILIIGRDRHLRQALEQQLTRRGRSWHSVAPGAELGAAFKSMGLGDRVVDLASYEAAIHGAGRGWDDAEFEELVQLSLQHGVGLLMLSHASVFVFRERQRWQEHEPAAPLSDTGRKLLAREQRLQGHSAALVLRTGHVFGAGREGLLHQLLQRMRHGGTIPLAAEPRQAFTSTVDLARVISALIDQLSCSDALWGTYHYQAADMLSCYDAGERLLAAAEQFWSLPAVTLEAAAQPMQGTVPPLDCRRIRNTFGIQQQPIGTALLDILRQLREQVHESKTG